MGWTFINDSCRKDVIAELTEGWENDWQDGKTTCTCLAKCFKGAAFAGTLYAVFERRFYDRHGVELQDKRDRFIFVALMKYSNYQNSRSWGYKDMTESEGPYVKHCPVKYFKMVKCPDNAWARRFRRDCESYFRLKQVRQAANKAIRRNEISFSEGQKRYDEAHKKYLDELEASDKLSDQEYEVEKEKLATA